MPDQIVVVSAPTPQGASVEDAGKRIESFLFPPKTKDAADATPEVPPVKTEQTPPEGAEGEESETPEGEEPEEESPEGEDDDDAPVVPQKFKVKVDGQELEVTLDEALAGYSRTEDYTRKTMAAAQARKEFEEKEVAAVRAERNEYSENLGKLADLLATVAGKEPDWAKLRNEVTPAEFTQEWAVWQQHKAQVAAVEAEKKRVADVQAEDAKAQLSKYVEGENRKLVENFPEWKDPEKYKAASKELVEYAKGLGYSEYELRTVYDHRVITVLQKALQFDKAAKKAPITASKIDRIIAASTPGSPTAPKKGLKLATAKGKLAKSGSVEDGAAAIELLI